MPTASRTVHQRSTSVQALEQPEQPSSVRVEPESQPTPTTERETVSREERWIDHVDELNFTLERIKALSHALFCVTQCNYDFFQNGDAPTKETLPLSLLASDLCDKADRHVDALYRRLRIHEEEAQADITDILEKRTQLDPEGQTLLDEVVRILSVATPAEKAILALGVKGVKQKAQQKNAARQSSTQGNNARNGQGKG